jgi:uncharacterized protein with FMN-binding domain
MKKVINILFAVLLVFIVLFTAGLLVFKKAGTIASNKTGDFIPVTHTLDDGLYSGQFRAIMGLVKAGVEFEIRDSVLNKCEFVRLTSTPGYGVKEKIITSINSSGDLDFEAITGATHTSSFAKAAIKDAVEKSGKQ